MRRILAIFVAAIFMPQATLAQVSSPEVNLSFVKADQIDFFRQNLGVAKFVASNSISDPKSELICFTVVSEIPSPVSYYCRYDGDSGIKNVPLASQNIAIDLQLNCIADSQMQCSSYRANYTTRYSSGSVSADTSGEYMLNQASLEQGFSIPFAIWRATQ